MWPFEITKESNLLYHCLSDCFSPYKDFFSKQTICSFPFTSYPLGWLMLIFPLVDHVKKDIFTSICSSSKSWTATRVKMTLMFVCFTTGEKISLKSIPSLSEAFCNKPHLVSVPLNSWNFRFSFVNPLAAQNSLLGWFLYKFPSIIFH